MKTSFTPPCSCLARFALLGGLLLTAASAHAQSAPVAPALSAATLAKYDTNRNGKLDPNEVVAMETAQKAASVSTDAAARPAQGAIVALSPFEVTSDNNRGYFQSNTMSGTRLNSKLEDLGQSITVMTKEQMSDFAMLDINDIFDHMASTEGTSSYSAFEADRTGAVTDNVSLNPNNANRVRGIGNANIAFNNIGMTGRVPVDPLWMDSLELSRGPNANIFGLGNASGTVNQVPATANLSRNFNKVELRVDSYEGWRASLDVNRKLTDKLAMRASYANQHTGFIRKPSGEDARRLSFQLKVRPFRNTTLSGSWYGYKNASVRPNFTPPRDYYTDWIKAGKPGWNPVTGLVTLANGQVYGNGNVLGSTTPYAAAPINFITGGAESRSTFRIGAPGEASYWARTRYTNATTTNGTAVFATTDPFAASDVGIGFLTTGPSETYTATQQPLYNSVAQPIRDRSIYDWTSTNLAANGKAWDNVNTYLAQLDQMFISTAKHTLAAQVTFLREDTKRLENQPMGPASVNSNVGQLQVDVNQVNLDGTPNPYFGRSYLRSSEPFLRDRPWLWDTTRAQSVYRIDFSQDKGLSKWLGTQQLLGYYEYKDQQNRQYAYRHSALGLDKAWQQKYAAANTPLGNRVQQATANTQYPIVPGNFARVIEQYYVGNTFGGGIQYAPSYFPEGASVPYVWGPSAGAMIRDVSAIGFTPSPDGGGGLASVQTIVKTKGAVLQSTFLDGRIVGTFGSRQDTVYDHNAPFPTLTADLRAYDRAASDQWLPGWRVAKGKTQNVSLVARPFRDLNFLKSTISSGSGVSRFLAEAVSSASLTYNTADNFIAQGPAFDLFLKPLPNQKGTSKDLGLWMTMLDGRLSIRFNRFNTKQLNLRNGDISTMAQRILRYEGFVGSDAYNLRTQTTAWMNGLLTGGIATNAQIAAAIKMPLEQYNGLQTIVSSNTYAAVMDAQSKGDELEINYNPTKHWTVGASVTKTEALNTAVGSAVDDYIAARMPIWTTLEDPRFTRTGQTINGVTTPYPNGPVNLPTGTAGHLLWWNILGTPFSTVAGYNATNSAATNFAGNVDAPMAVFRAQIGRPRPQIRKYSAKFNTRYNLAGISDNPVLKAMSVGGSLRYASKGSLGFYGQGYTPGMDLTLASNRIVQLDPNRPIYSSADINVDVFVNYRTKLFADKVRANFQLNVKNLPEEGGRLQKTGAFFDGRASTYRIVDPRQFILSASFDL